jgi:hypothetical protein
MNNYSGLCSLKLDYWSNELMIGERWIIGGSLGEPDTRLIGHNEAPTYLNHAFTAAIEQGAKVLSICIGHDYHNSIIA